MNRRDVESPIDPTAFFAWFDKRLEYFELTQSAVLARLGWEETVETSVRRLHRWRTGRNEAPRDQVQEIIEAFGGMWHDVYTEAEWLAGQEVFA